MGAVLRRFLRDDSAQDVVEYSFLALFVGLVGLLLWPAVLTLIGARYTDYLDPVSGVQSLWETPDPVLGP